MSTHEILNLILEEREKQRQRWDALDKLNHRNDWVSYITNYAGQAALMHNNDPAKFQTNMVKIAALAMAAIEAHDKGYC